jgi:hypothetical protein
VSRDGERGRFDLVAMYSVYLFCFVGFFESQGSSVSLVNTCVIVILVLCETTIEIRVQVASAGLSSKTL